MPVWASLRRPTPPRDGGVVVWETLQALALQRRQPPDPTIAYRDCSSAASGAIFAGVESFRSQCMDYIASRAYRNMTAAMSVAAQLAASMPLQTLSWTTRQRGNT